MTICKLHSNERTGLTPEEEHGIISRRADSNARPPHPRSSAFICVSAVVAIACLQTPDARAAVRVRSADEYELDRRKNAPAVLTVSPGTLSVVMDAGATKLLSLSVGNDGGSVVEWTATAPEWARLKPASGSLGYEQGMTVTVVVGGAALVPGTNAGEIVITAAGAGGSPARVALTVEVNALEKPDQPDTTEQPPTPVPTATNDDDQTGSLLSPPRELDEMAMDDRPRRGREAAQSNASGGLGVHAGLMMASGAQREQYGAGYAFDVFYRGGSPSSRMGWEVSLGVGGAESESGVEKNTLARGSASALFYLARLERAAVYAIGGMSLLNEEVDDSELGISNNTGGLVDLGVGGTFGGRFDARVLYSMLVGSENVGGILGVMGGMTF